MKLSIGIITAEKSVELIREAHGSMSAMCDVTYLSYSSMRQLSDVYEQNAHRFEGLIFSGKFPYSYIVSRVGIVLKPHAYFELTDRDYYKALAGILYRFRWIDVSRIIMDRPNVPVNFKDVFNGMAPVFFDPIAEDMPGIESAYELAMQQSLRLWREKKIDLVVTRLTNLTESLRLAGIPFELLFPSAASMLDVVSSLCGRIQYRRLLDSMVASGIVSEDRPDADYDFSELQTSLDKFNEQNGMPLVIRKNRSIFELTTSNETLRDITQGYTNCRLTGYLHDRLGLSICLGWGLGRDIVSSQKNAMAALRESMRNRLHHAYLVDDSGEQVGPMASGRGVTLSGIPSANTAEMSTRLGISPANLQKLIDLQERRGINLFSSADLSFYLNVTPRSANRILLKLAEFGGAKVVRSSQPNSRGRPFKIYEVDYRKLFSE
ncbi:MAG: hypothetical protein LBQ90_06405 [Synergistaceae bacterium]|nr:hypothetical protein [Synergistaceae bacterium]